MSREADEHAAHRGRWCTDPACTSEPTAWPHWHCKPTCGRVHKVGEHRCETGNARPPSHIGCGWLRPLGDPPALLVGGAAVTGEDGPRPDWTPAALAPSGTIDEHAAYRGRWCFEACKHAPTQPHWHCKPPCNHIHGKRRTVCRDRGDSHLSVDCPGLRPFGNALTRQLPTPTAETLGMIHETPALVIVACTEHATPAADCIPCLHATIASMRQTMDRVSRDTLEAARKRGPYWLTPEGRAELRECFPDLNDTVAVRPLLDALEAEEAENVELRAVLDAVGEKGRDLQHEVEDEKGYAANANAAGLQFAGQLEDIARSMRIVFELPEEEEPDTSDEPCSHGAACTMNCASPEPCPPEFSGVARTPEEFAAKVEHSQKTCTLRDLVTEYIRLLAGTYTTEQLTEDLAAMVQQADENAAREGKCSCGGTLDGGWCDRCKAWPTDAPPPPAPTITARPAEIRDAHCPPESDAYVTVLAHGKAHDVAYSIMLRGTVLSIGIDGPGQGERVARVDLAPSMPCKARSSGGLSCDVVGDTHDTSEHGGKIHEGADGVWVEAPPKPAFPPPRVVEEGST